MNSLVSLILVYELDASQLNLSSCLSVLAQLSYIFGIHELLDARDLSATEVEDEKMLVGEWLVE